ncbi:peptidase M50 [Caproiciproducens sp. NJN-50]|uniref:peptidase M50 n=1 Tax=Acutalibacteraceae TaxID=3082771 RepID=UPI000FFE21A1|nr:MULTISPECIES: peptidase M50 [Acutalibacteraceae]QAT49596.1 peptidase M50 [Caproiciproducens sp. NJN-50]
MTFSVGGCRITFSYFFFALVALLLLFDRSGVAAAGLAAAALHECSHLGVMYAFKSLPEEIRFNIFGIDIVRNSRPDRGYWKDAVVSLSGPAANLLAAGLFYVFRSAADRNMMLANFTLFLFNILPIEPLDGGQALYALLCLRWEPSAACRAVGIVSFLFLAPLSAVGFLTLFHSPGNYTLLLVCIYLMCLLVFKRGKYF